MSMRYPSKRDWRLGLVLFGTVGLLFALFVLFRDLVSFVLAVAPSALLLWIWYDTSYSVRSGYIAYRSGPLRGRIAIDDIREITRHTYSWGGIRPALSFDCLRIQYDRFKDIWISPQNEDAFLQEVREANPEVVIRG